jgi:hypothetical protein
MTPLIGVEGRLGRPKYTWSFGTEISLFFGFVSSLASVVILNSFAAYSVKRNSKEYLGIGNTLLDATLVKLFEVPFSSSSFALFM